MEFIRSLPLTYGSHIHCHKFLHGRRDLRCTTMPNLLKVAEEDAGGMGWLQPSSLQRLQRCHEHRRASFIIQMARAYKAVCALHARVKSYKITHFDAQAARFFHTGCARI